MDIRRIVLLGGIVFVTILLLRAWNEDYPPQTYQPNQPQTVTTSSLEKPNIQDTGGDNLPDLSEDNSEEDDIPDLTPISSTASSPADAINIPQTEKSKGKIISISTDTLEVKIDTYGGDIIGISLPKHLKYLEDPKSSYRLLEKSPMHTYIAQSGMTGNDGPDWKKSATGKKQRPRYQAAQNAYRLTEDNDKLVVDLIHHQQEKVKITKRFTFTRNDYTIKTEFIIENNSDRLWRSRMFGQIKRDRNKVDDESSSFAPQPFLGAAISTPDKNYEKFDFDDIDDGETFSGEIQGSWVAFSQHYFLSAWIPSPEQKHYYSIKKGKNSSYYYMGFTSPTLKVDAGSKKSASAIFYVGPKDQYRLEELSPHLDLVIDYGWLWFIAKPLFWLLIQIQNLVSNWGFSIILLTVVVKALFYHLSASGYRSMAKMKVLAPKMQEIKERYGNDRTKMSQKTMELYRKEGANPLGGCFPLLIQMPVFLALYWVLMESVELRHAPFIGWIQDLSSMDPYFILPLLMGGSMYLQQTLNPPPPDPMQAKVFKMMPIFFTFLFIWFPSGLVLYWTVNNLLSILQQYTINKSIEGAKKTG